MKMVRGKKILKKILVIFLIIFIAGFIFPQRLIMPVEGAGKTSYHPNSFWYYPWGTSVTHKGVDIFAREGTHVRSAVSGLVLYRGKINKGGNVLLILGPKWRLHYYAHLQKLNTSQFNFVSKNEVIATVGTTGNAQGKPAHLHYSVVTPIPYFWRIDSDRQGWKKMFYLDPVKYLNSHFQK